LYKLALRRKEEVLELNYKLILEIVGSLSNIYINKGKLEEVEYIFKQVLQRSNKVLLLKYALRLQIISNLGIVYKK
jgi:hypothetical protein